MTHGDDAHDASSTAGAEPDAHARGGPPHESPWVVTVPLILLAIPSIYAGWTYIEPMLFGDWFGDSIFVATEHDVLAELREELHGVAAVHRCTASRTAPFWLALAGIATAWLPLPDATRRCRRGSRRGSRRSTRCSTTSTTSTASTTGSSPAARGALGALLSQRRRPDDHRRHLRQRLGAGSSAGLAACCGASSPATSITTRSR